MKKRLLLAAVCILAAGVVILALVRGRTRMATAVKVKSGAEGAMPYMARLGSQTYHHYCATCHGQEGRGDGFNAFNCEPRPRDLATPAFQKAKQDRDLYDAIENGGRSVGYSAAMPPWGKTLSPRQIQALVAYIRQLGGGSQPRSGGA